MLGVATLSAALTVLLVVLLFVAIFDLDSAGKWAVLGGILVAGGMATAEVHRRSTPTHALPQPAKRRREQRHVAALSGALLAVLLMIAYAVSFDLNSWAEWASLGATVAVVVGLVIALNRP